MSSPLPKLRPSLSGNAPSLRLERECWESGMSVVVGLDEVGRGAWAGPLTVAAVVVPAGRRVYKIRDSKLLTPDEREGLYERITSWVIGYGVGHVDARECDDLGMSDAQRLAARRALDDLGLEWQHALVDGNWNFVGDNVTTVVGGDRFSLSIAAASIVAKVTRDRMMIAADEHYPYYEFSSNKGYPSPFHRAALHGWGPSPIHRRSWAFMDASPISRRLLRSAQGTLF